jgi:hypothetical protein
MPGFFTLVLHTNVVADVFMVSAGKLSGDLAAEHMRVLVMAS